MFKKMLMIASAALAVVALAAPASALADWTHGEAPLEGTADVTFAGPASFSAPAAEAGASATLSATVTLEEGSTGKLSSVSATNCVGTGKLAGLTCTSTFEATKGTGWAPVSSTDPWIVHCNTGGSITITHIRITNHYYLDKAHTIKVKETVLTGDVTVTPHKPAAISTVTLSSENAEVAGAGPAIISGELAATPSGTYGCE